MYNNEPPDTMEYNSLLRPLRSREPEGIWNLISIVKEMIKRGDKNGKILLTVITDCCLVNRQIPIWWYQTQTSTPYLQAAGNVQRNTNQVGGGYFLLHFYNKGVHFARKCKLSKKITRYSKSFENKYLEKSEILGCCRQN